MEARAQKVIFLWWTGPGDEKDLGFKEWIEFVFGRVTLRESSRKTGSFLFF